MDASDVRSLGADTKRTWSTVSQGSLLTHKG